MREFKGFASVGEKNSYVEALETLKREFESKFAEAGIEDVLFMDAEAPYVLICYHDFQIDILSEKRVALRERIECDEIGLVRSSLEEECKRDVTNPMDMLRRAFEVLAWEIDDLDIGIVPVVMIDPDTQVVTGMTLECGSSKKNFPLSYYNFAKIKHAVAWHQFLHDCNVLKRVEA